MAACMSSVELLQSASSLSSQVQVFPSNFPSHKRIPGTHFVVNGLDWSGPWSTAYFLSYFHDDYCTGLTSTWNRGIIFCSHITARLVRQALKVEKEFIAELAIGEVFVIDGCQVTFVDADHCPGAVQMLFQVPSSSGQFFQRFIHTGDMRYTPVMKEDALLCSFIGADAIFLDISYCNPELVFPPQHHSIDYIADNICKLMKQGNTMFLISTSVIGKEKLLTRVANRCKCRVYVEEKEMQLLKCIEMEELEDVYTNNPFETSVHVVGSKFLGDSWPFFCPNFANMDRLRQERQLSRVIGFITTGWTGESSKNYSVERNGDDLEIHFVPYSEHSNYDDLKEYVGFLRPREIVPTVGIDGAMTNHFRNFVNETAKKIKAVKGFKRKSSYDADVDQASELILAPKAAFGRGAKKKSKDDSSQSCSESLETKSQLQNVLPSWVTDAQIAMLNRQAHGDLSVAITLFFQQESILHAEVDEKLNAVEKSSALLETGLVPKPSAILVGPKKSVTGTPKLKASVANRSKSSKVRRKSFQQEKGQATILSFFKKSDSATTSVTTLDPRDSGKDSEVKQLVEILEGSLSESDALVLLEKAHGNVALAVELFYSSKADGGEQTPSLQDSRGLHANQALINLVALPLDKYDPVGHACWNSEEPAPYLHLARTFELVEKERSRLKTTEMLCNMFRSILSLSPNDLLPAVYLTTNRIAPDYENVELNIGGSLVSAVIEEATGTPRAKLKEMYNIMGDLGDVAQACRRTQSMLVPPHALSIRHVFATFRNLSKETGPGSAIRKKGMVLTLLRACREKETTYLVRSLIQNLRIGAMILTVMSALSQAVVLHQNVHMLHDKCASLKSKLQEASTAFVEAYNLLPNFDRLVPLLLNRALETVTISPGTPIKPMLAKIANGVEDIVKQLQTSFTCEYKYDGYRAQIHLLEDDSIFVFSRNCENVTSRFPDVTGNIRRAVKEDVRSFVIDSEVVAIERVNNHLLPFQTLSTRERGTAVDVDKIRVDVCIFIFDIMYANGEPLVKFPLRLRRERLRELFPNLKPGYVQLVTELSVDMNGRDVAPGIRNFLDESICASCEGIMVKALDETSVYCPAKRSDTWLKVKRDYVEGLSDSLDLVPVGAWHGNGRKAGWYSPILVACYDAEKEEFQSVCRVMSGFTDSFYKEMKLFYSSEERILSRKPSYYQTLEQPDVWFSATCVWEIRGADLTVSPVHRAAVGMVHPSRGISLRFPRFIRQRADRKPDDATSPSQIVDMFHLQTRKLSVARQEEEEEEEEEEEDDD